MKKKIITTLILIILVIIATIYPFSLTNLYSLDEIWNYGFAKSILDGLIPYKDFSMIIPPLFPYITAVILAIFGQKLLIYYAFIAVMSVSITYISYKKIGYPAILVYLLLLIYSSNGYNTITLLLLLILLTTIDKKIEKKDIIVPIIISLMALSKQTMALLIIPSLFYSKNKKKSLLTYIICFLILLTYLIFNNNLIEFIDYCFLGMIDFTKENKVSIPIYLILEIVVCIYCIYTLIKTKGKKQEYFYVLMYQIVTFPIVDVSHFVLAFAPFVHIIFYKNNMKKMMEISVFALILTTILSILLIGTYTKTYQTKDLLGFGQKDNFLQYKLMPSVTDSYIETMDIQIKKYKDHKLYIFGNYAYIIKLALDIPINKYDLINNGNMGYNGAERYIKEIEETCKKEKCLFIVKESELTRRGFNQTNNDILRYVVENYKKVYSSSTFGLYKTKDNN